MFKYDHQRINRAKQQNIYIVDRQITETDAVFNIMGTTGKIYTVSLTGLPSCTCPDYTRNHKRCKHILFMLVRIFNCSDPYQILFTPLEIQHYIQQYNSSFTKYLNNEPLCQDDTCVICLEPLQNGTSYVFCSRSCRRCLHSTCFQMLTQYTTNYQRQAKCPYCKEVFISSLPRIDTVVKEEVPISVSSTSSSTTVPPAMTIPIPSTESEFITEFANMTV